MNLITRRECVSAGLLTLVFATVPNCACAAATVTEGCLLSDDQFERIHRSDARAEIYKTGEEPIIPTSPDQTFDRALARTAAYLSDKFEVFPGFGYYDDVACYTAYATTRSRMGHADGTVLMGLGLLGTLRKLEEHPEVAVAAVCAHEWGHVLQFKYGLIDRVNQGRPTKLRSELQADFFAGYFAGLRKKERPSFPAVIVATTLRLLGGDKPTSHGSFEQRGAAAVRGFECAFREEKILSDAISESTRYVMTIA